MLDKRGASSKRGPLDLLKGWVRGIRQHRRAQALKKTTATVSMQRMVEDLRSMGIKQGDSVMLHSSLKSVGYVPGGAETVVKAFLEVLSPSGTLIVPAFYMKGNMYETCMSKDYVFDPQTVGTVLGAIPKAALRMTGAERSIHPTHSVVAIGKHARYITESHHTAASTFGKDSPWDRLMALDGKIFALGLKMGRNTFSHVLEDRMGDKFPLPVRMKEMFRVKCRDWEGNLVEVIVRPLDPKYAKVRSDQADRQDLRDYLWEDFTREGIFTLGTVGQAPSWVAPANRYYAHLEKLMNEGITIYSSGEDLKKRPIGGLG